MPSRTASHERQTAHEGGRAGAGQRVAGARDIGDIAWRRRFDRESLVALKGKHGVGPARQDGAIDAEAAQPAQHVDRVRIPAKPGQRGCFARVQEQAGEVAEHAGKPRCLGRRDGDGEDRFSGGQFRDAGKRVGRKIGVAEQRVGGPYRLAHRRPAKLLGKGKVVEPHVGKRRDHVAAPVEKRRVARRRAVEEGHGKIADTGGRDCPRHGLAGRVAAAHRHHPAFHAAPRGVAQGVEGAAADVFAHRSRIGGARHEVDGDPAPAVDMRAAYAENDLARAAHVKAECCRASSRDFADPCCAACARRGQCGGGSSAA